jgi:uncharacterized protein (DUF1499 family)
MIAPFLMPPVLGLLLLLLLSVDGFAGNEGQRKDVQDCPSSPNCVSSLSKDYRHFIDPLHFKDSPDEAFERLKQIVKDEKRSTIIAEERDYVHAEFRTVLGFVDDVEFSLDRENRVVHMRSASKVGYWDLGVNRRRLEEIRSQFLKKCRKL